LCFTPQRKEATWELDSATLLRLATATNGDLFVLGNTPAAIYRLRLSTSTPVTFANLSTLPAQPTDMVAANGKVYVAAGARVLVFDEDTGELTLDLGLPWPAEVDAITALCADGDTLYLGADLTAGGSALYSFTWATPKLLASHTETITAIAVAGSTVYCGDAAGNVLGVSGTALAVLYATGEATVARLAVTADGQVLVGTGTSGKLFRSLGSVWQELGDFGWDTVQGVAVWNGYLHAGGVGTGGNYLYMDGLDGWLQTFGLADATAINDLLTVQAVGSEQLFAATSNGGATAFLYRLELAQGGGSACGLQLFDLQAKALQ
jgi:hypothetical protein